MKLDNLTNDHSKLASRHLIDAVFAFASGDDEENEQDNQGNTIK